MNMDKKEKFSEENLKLKKKLRKLMEEYKELSRVNKELKNYIFIDEITQFYNSQYLDKRLEEEMKRAKRYSLFLSLVLINIKSLSKEIRKNGVENLGEKLRHLGKFIQANMRDTDIISQFDQDIFALILPETNIEGANTLSERLKEQILLAYSAFDIKNIKSGYHEKALSIGIAEYPTDARMKDELIKKGKEMLEISKESNDNMICSSLKVQ